MDKGASVEYNAQVVLRIFPQSVREMLGAELRVLEDILHSHLYTVKTSFETSREYSLRRLIENGMRGRGRGHE